MAFRGVTKGAGAASLTHEAYTMSLGPIEVIVVGFPENRFTGEVTEQVA